MEKNKDVIDSALPTVHIVFILEILWTVTFHDKPLQAVTSIASEPYWLVHGLFWFVLFKKRPWQHCADVLFHSHQSRQHASPMLCSRKWIGKKTSDGDFDVPQSVICHQQPSLWLSVTMCLKELSGCRLTCRPSEGASSKRVKTRRPLVPEGDSFEEWLDQWFCSEPRLYIGHLVVL